MVVSIDFLDISHCWISYSIYDVDSIMETIYPIHLIIPLEFFGNNLQLIRELKEQVFREDIN